MRIVSELEKGEVDLVIGWSIKQLKRSINLLPESGIATIPALE